MRRFLRRLYIRWALRRSRVTPWTMRTRLGEYLPFWIQRHAHHWSDSGLIRLGLLAALLSIGGCGARGEVIDVANVGIACLLTMALRLRWLTDNQAIAKFRAAAHVQPDKPMEAAVLVAEASLLGHIGQKTYDARRVEPTSAAVRMLEAEMKAVPT